MTPMIIGITGPRYSGKKTVVKRLSEIIDMTVLHLDDYCKNPEDTTVTIDGRKNFDHPENYKYEDVYSDITSLLNGEIVEKKTLHHAEGNDAGMIVLRPSQIIIVEGLYALRNQEIRNFYDVSFYFCIEEDEQEARRKKQEEPTISKEYLWNVMIPTYQEHGLRQKEHATYTLNAENSEKVASRVLQFILLSYVTRMRKETQSLRMPENVKA